MQLRWLVGLALACVACNGLKDAAPGYTPADSGTDGGIDDGSTVEGGESDGGGLDGTATKDGTTADAADAAPTCDGPCTPEDLATGLPQATAITVDAQDVYFASEGKNTPVQQCPKTGCGGAPILLGTGYAFGIAVIGGFVHWGDFSSGKVWRCAIGGCGGNPTAIALNQTSIRGVATDGVKIYWSANNDILGCDPAACTPFTVRSGTGPIFAMAAEQATVLYVDSAANKVYACASPTCATPLLLGTGTHDVSSYSGKAFWRNGATNLIVSCPITGCSNAPKTIGTSFTPTHPASDGSYVYFRDELSFKIYRCPAATGCAAGAEVFANDQRGQPGGNLAIDGTHVYWTTASAVRRLAK
jgi:hypothetical protein